MELSEKSDSPDARLTCNINLAEFYRRTRRFEKAKTHIYRAISISKKEKITNTNYLIALNNRMAAIMNESGNIDSSIYFSNKAIALCRKTNNKMEEARSLNEIGLAFKQSNKLDSAIHSYQLAEHIWRSLDDFDDAALALNNRAMVYSENGFPDRQILKINLVMGILIQKVKIEIKTNTL